MALCTSLKDGDWSDLATFDKAPTKLDDVLIKHKVTVGDAEAKRVDITLGAALTLTGTLHAYGSLVNRGTLTTGAHTDRHGNIAVYFHVPDDRLFTGNGTPGPVVGDPDDHSDTDIGLWCMEGSITELEGPEVTPWVYAKPIGVAKPWSYGLTQNLCFETNTLTLASQVLGWKQGDTLLLVDTTGKQVLATLVSVSPCNSTITYTTVTPISGYSYSKEGKQILPVVANLSRRVVIASFDVKKGDTNHRAHTVFMHHAHVHLDNIEFRDLGPRGKLGRYPVHFHHLMKMVDCPDNEPCGIVGCSIWQSCEEAGNRFIAIHNTQNIVCESNVGYMSYGHGFLMEQGNETGVSVKNNLAVNVHGTEVLKVTDEAVSKHSHAYWLRDLNMITGNVAADCDVGFVSLKNKTVGGSNPPLDNNSAYGCPKYGFWTQTPDTHFQSCKAAFCGFSGWAVITTFGYDSKNMLLTDAFGVLNGSDPTYKNQLYVSNGVGVTVKGGVFAAPNQAFQGHYAPCSIVVEGASIATDTLVYVAYGASVMRFDRCNIWAPKFMTPFYPRSQLQPGFIVVDGVWYTSLQNANIYNFPGTAVPNGIKLNAPPLTSGFIQPPTFPPYSGTQWNVSRAVVGPPVFAKGLFASVKKQYWLASLETPDLGYPYGFPPGDYLVSFWDKLDQPIPGKTNVPVTVKSGEVLVMT